jgi:hypothetical protein
MKPNRFNGLAARAETVETVLTRERTLITRLKPGVNEINLK